ncbi:ATP-binding protein [Actinokineospora sp. UTMC 2448]|uniref:ATP-binding protein n=1 Tax=Actinokineospora sp. UTMC 2448 TaxID=2268449 RepID=UPI00216490B7|nr:ATP-binding protein [Actinokineospora sp. UTMC 2448]UVS77331.1 Type IV secretory pathway, VirB4 component [Actinokineospora sp. UTMC 2448]
MRIDRHGARGVGAGRLAHRMRLPAHTASSEVLKTWYPWVMDPGLAVPGAYAGVDLYSQASFLFDPWALYAAGAITSPNGLIIGEIGSGKSSLMKCLILRFLAAGIPFSWVDVKDECSDLARAVGVEPLRLGPGLRVRLNPLAGHRRHISQTDAEWRAAVKTRRLSLLEGPVPRPTRPAVDDDRAHRARTRPRLQHRPTPRQRMRPARPRLAARGRRSPDRHRRVGRRAARARHRRATLSSPRERGWSRWRARAFTSSPPKRGYARNSGRSTGATPRSGPSDV